jgi:nucleotide-binding universal stress UspA family protein
LLVVVGARVIVGVSGSLRSLGALRAGVAHACLTEATLLAVLAWAPEGGEVAYLRAPCPMLLELWEHDACERMLAAFDAAFGGIPAGVSVQTMVVRGRPGPLLVSVADKPDDLLVVGYGGRSWAGYVLHGSVTRYCLAHARCPVLAVPPPEMIRKLRPWPIHWRMQDLAGQPAGNARAAAIVEHRASVATQDLPAYQGAPYYQPRPPSRKRRVLRQLRLATILGAGILLLILTGVLLSRSMP